MPKTPMDYSKTIMYKIVCNDLNVKECYVGHTINMTKRKWSHKSVCNNEKNKGHNLKIYKIIRENGGWDNWSMLLVETFPCKDKHEACKRERELYEQIDVIMNTRRPYRTHEEHKEYNKQNHKKYHEENKEQHKEQDKQRYQKNKEKIAEKHKEKIECEFCSKLLQKCSMSRHHKTCKSKPVKE
jgi:hypothetical protein